MISELTTLQCMIANEIKKREELQERPYTEANNMKIILQGARIWDLMEIKKKMEA